MAIPKTYIYAFDNIKVMVCSYSMELFNNLIKHARSNGLIFTGDLEIVSHKIFNRSNCNCREIINDAIQKIDNKFKTFERIILPLEILELDYANAHLFLCEVYSSHKSPLNKLRIINATIKNSNQFQQQQQQIGIDKPKNCLLQLYKILNEEIWIKNDKLGRNNSFNGGKSIIYKDCLKEIAKELSSKGALPRDLSQKCIYSRDNNRCWFDYCRLMDICITHKLSAREIADFIKHLAAVDPMQPDPVICIKNKFENSESHNNCRKESKIGESENSSSSENVNSFTHSLTSSSSLSELVVCKTNCDELSNNRNVKHKFNNTINSRGKHSRTKKTTKHTQTETQTDLPSCKCFKNSPFGSKYHSRSNNLEAENYLWSPDHYNSNEYNYYQTMDEQFLDQDDFYNNGANDYSSYDNRGCHSVKGIIRRNKFNNGASSNFRDFEEQFDEGDYDPRIYEEFIKENGCSDNDENGQAPGSYDDLDQQNLYDDDDFERMSNHSKSRHPPSQNSKYSATSERIGPNKSTFLLRPAHRNNQVTRIRSSSQPMLPTKFRTYKLLSNTNNSQDNINESTNLYPIANLENKTTNTVNSSTQTTKKSPAFSDMESSPLKKFASDSALCIKTLENEIKNNVNKETDYATKNQNQQDLRVKTFKVEAVQTDSPPSDLSGNVTASFRSSSQQIQFPDLIFSPNSLNKRRNTRTDNKNIYFQQHSTKTHLKALCNSSRFWNEKFNQNPIDNFYSYSSINRNANNHSLSRSASSRNSQIVEIENDSIEKVSSVLVEADSRSIILYREFPNERLQNLTRINNSRSPFFEIGSPHSFSVNYKNNMNVNNAIKSVTVSNQVQTDRSYHGVKIYRCGVPGCRNLTEGSNCTCLSHTQQFSPDSSCSPERCLSRLSCIVGLNKQIFENPEIDRQTSIQMNALQQALYGPYNDEECAKVLSIASHKLRKNPCIPLQSEYVNNDSQYLLSLSDPNRRFCNRHDSPNLLNPNFLSQPALQPMYSATKLSQQNLCECQDLQSRRYLLQEIQDIHNPAPIAYQPPIGESALPLTSTSIADCRSAKLSNCTVQPKLVSSTKSPLNGAYSMTHRKDISQFEYDIPMPPQSLKPGYEIIKEDFRDHPFPAVIMNPSKEFQLSQIHQNINQHPRHLKSPCGKRIPVNLQLCPVEGCLNLTSTNNPPCLDERFNCYNRDLPDKCYPTRFSGSPLRGNENDPARYQNYSGTKMASPANCEVILDDELINELSSHSASQRLSGELNKSVTNTSLTNKIKTVSSDSKSLQHKESNISKKSNISSSKDNKSKQISSRKFDLTSNITDENSNKQSIKHVSSHHSLPRASESYKPSSLRGSVHSDNNEMESIKLYLEKSPNKGINDVDSNVNHISEFRSLPINKNEQIRVVSISHYDITDNIYKHRTSPNFSKPFSESKDLKDLSYIKKSKEGNWSDGKLLSRNNSVIGNPESFIKSTNSKEIKMEESNGVENSKLYAVRNITTDEIRDQTDGTGISQISVPGKFITSISDIDKVLSSDRPSKKAPFCSPINSHLRNIEPDYTIEKLSKQFVTKSHNESFSPISVFGNLDNDNSKVSQIILVEPPDSHLNDSRVDSSEIETKALLIELNEKHLVEDLQLNFKNVESNTSEKKTSLSDKNNIPNIDIEQGKLFEILNNEEKENDGPTIHNLHPNSIEFNTWLENENILAHIKNATPNVFEIDCPNGIERNKSDICLLTLNTIESDLTLESNKKSEELHFINKDDQLNKTKPILNSNFLQSMGAEYNVLTNINMVTYKSSMIKNEVIPLERIYYPTADKTSGNSKMGNIQRNITVTSSNTLLFQHETFSSTSGNFPSYQTEEIIKQSPIKSPVSSQAISKKQLVSTLFREKTDSTSKSKQNQLTSKSPNPKMKSIKGDLKSQKREIRKSSDKWKNISVFNKRFKPPDPFHNKSKNPCEDRFNIYSYALEVDINKTFPGTATPYLTCKLGNLINNSSNIKLVSIKGNNRLNSDKVLLDNLYQNNPKVKSNSFLHYSADSNFVEGNSKISFSTPDLIFNNVNLVMMPEKFRLKSNLALEYREPNSDSLAVVVDQSTETLFFLTTVCVTIQTCNHTTPLLTVNQDLSKAKKSKIKRLFKSIRSTKSQRQQFCRVQNQQKSDKTNKFLKTIFLLEFKSKMLSFLRKCKSNRINENERGQIISSDIESMVNDSESYSYLSDKYSNEIRDDQIPQILNISKCNLWTRSCCELHIKSRIKNEKPCFRIIRKRSFSEPTIENGYKTQSDSNNFSQTSSLSCTEIPTSGLSLLCFEVLEKLERKLGRNPRLVENLTAKRFMEAVDFWSQSSKDTLKLIGRALQYLHGNHLEESRQSNKTLDSVSSIRTCSADCIESISSLRQQIIRPIVSTDTAISAYNKYLS